MPLESAATPGLDRVMASLNPFEKRFWALIASYSLGSVAIAPVFYLSPLYLNKVMKLSQVDLGKVLWIPPLGWEIGYFVWGWIFDRYAADKDRPVFMFFLLATLIILRTIPAKIPHGPPRVSRAVPA